MAGKLTRKGIIAGTFGQGEEDTPSPDVSVAPAQDQAPVQELRPAPAAPPNPAAAQPIAGPVPSPTPPAPPAPARKVAAPAADPVRPRAVASAPKPTRLAVPEPSVPPRPPVTERPADHRTQTEHHSSTSPETARQAVDASLLLARRASGEWGPYAVRLPRNAKERLGARRARDFEELGVKYHETHYLDAALARVPADLAEAMRWVDQYLDTLGITTPSTVGTTSRVRRSTASHMDTVTNRLRAQAGYGKIGALQTAAVMRFLDELDLATDVVDLDSDE